MSIEDEMIKLSMINSNARRIERDVQGTSTFYGFAESNTASTAAPDWLIARVTIAGGEHQLLFATQKFNRTWDDRIDFFANPPFANLNSLRFRGSNAQIQHNDYVDALDVITGTAAFSLSFWFQTGSSGEACIVGKQSGSSGQGWRITSHSNGTRLHFHSGSNRCELRSPNLSLADSSWHHVGWSFSSVASPIAGNFTLVIDGVDETSNVVVSNDTFSGSSNSSSLFKLGVRDSNALDFDGLLDEIGIYHNVQLSVADIQSLYNLGGAGKPGDALNLGPSTANLIYFNRCGDNDTFDQLTNLGTAGAELVGTAVNMIASDFFGETP